MKGKRKMKERNKMRTAVTVYAAVLYLIWALVEIVLSPRLKSMMQPFTASIIIEAVLKTLIWIIPSVMLARRFDGEMYIKKDKPLPEKLKKVNFIPIVILLAVFTAYLLGMCYLSKGKIAVNKSFCLGYIPLCAMIGISEESVFRGLFLNSLLKDGRKKWIAVLIDSLMFLAVHFPIWYANGEFVQNFTSGGFISVMVLSTIFSIVFMKTETFAVSAAVHGYWDLLCYMLL